MKALLFPGQGSQIVGMGSEFYKNFDIAKKLFEKADNKLGYKISKIILEGPEDQLKLTQNTQPAIMTVGFVIFNILKDEFNLDLKNFKLFAGHSLGEYTALVCAGALDFEDALFLLHERGKAMQEAVPIGSGGMLAVLGTELNEINKIILGLKNNKVCEIANDNAEGQIIISGNIESIEELQNILKQNKRKSIKLPVSAPFHCSLMKRAADKMKDKIDTIKFKSLSHSIVSNVTAKGEQDTNNIKKLLVEQIYSKVRWRESILYMVSTGITEFVEIGPGKVLSGLVKRIAKDKKSNNINSINDIKNFLT
jgi:[acyl-carrier-protein] S-malonyltransferase